MKAKWTCPTVPNALAVVNDAVIITAGNAVVALDDKGDERWRRVFARVPDGLTPCGSGVAFALADRRSPTQIAALDLDGKDAWKYDRRWGLMFRGIAGDARGLVLYGQDYGTPVSDHWVGLDAASGNLTFDVPPPVDGAPWPADAWLLASRDDGDAVVRTDRNGSNATQITSLAHVTFAANGELLLLNTRNDDGPTEVVAVEVSTGKERWRAPGGNNAELGLDNRHAAWVVGDDTSGHPVVHDLTNGRQIWRGDPLPPVKELDGYVCRLAGQAVVCYCMYRDVVYFTLAAASPIQSRAWNAHSASASKFLDARHFLETSGDGLTCWEMT